MRKGCTAVIHAARAAGHATRRPVTSCISMALHSSSPPLLASCAVQAHQQAAATPRGSGLSSSGTSGRTSTRRPVMHPQPATAAAWMKRGLAMQPAAPQRAPVVVREQPPAAVAAAVRTPGGRACPQQGKLWSTHSASSRRMSCRMGAHTAWACWWAATATGEPGWRWRSV